jgi:hypothetical protein
MAADPPYKLSIQSHGCLDFVLQELRRFPACGADLVEAALKQALSAEPDGDVRGRIQNVIDGEPLD